jgi:DMSO/TMAO reductase YedYZ molybdopterin-dependent catalytic subunit
VQITGSSLIAYDVATGDEKKLDEELVVALAYEADGKPLDQQRDGDLRLVALTSKGNQVTDGHWSVKWVTKIQVKALGGEWTLEMKGAIEDTIDRGSFESCATTNCHGVTWKDEKAQEWSGVPLYLLLGRVDDTNKHETGAFNRELADAGYKVEIVTADGSKVVLDASQTTSKKNILIANKLDGNPLGDADFPLRLVGTGLEGSDMVGKIGQISVVLP